MDTTWKHLFEVGLGGGRLFPQNLVGVYCGRGVGVNFIAKKIALSYY
jgi:hypothetical protein